MYNTKKFAVGSPDVYDEINAMHFPDDDKEIKKSDLVYSDDRMELRFGGENE